MLGPGLDQGAAPVMVAIASSASRATPARAAVVEGVDVENSALAVRSMGRIMRAPPPPW
jgi:hypothetical protein